MPIILLIRHGDNDLMHKFLVGRTPGVHLNEKGQKQAQKVVELLAGAPLMAVYSSPMERALETALPLAESRELEIQQRPGLIELNYGAWMGHSFSRLRRTKLWKQLKINPAEIRFPEGESICEAQERAVAELESIVSTHNEKDLIACVTHGDIVQNAYGYGLFTGGLGAHYGAEALGATVIPISGGNTERQLMVLSDFGVTAICCTPSYFIHLIEKAKEANVGFGKLKVGVFGAEPWSDSMRVYIQGETGIRAHDIYGLSEIIGPGVGIECHRQDGLHIFEDHFYPEIVDPKTGEVLPDGGEGELVLTTLSKQAMPMIRYRTRDITAIVPEPCACGRTLRRIRRIGRRSDDMFIIRGVNVFPSQVETALLRVEGTLPHYQIVLTRDRGLDEMEVQVEVTAEVFSDEIRGLQVLQGKLETAIEHVLGIRVKVTLVAPRTIARSEGKAKRVLDKRKV